MERLTKWVLPAVLALALAFTGMWGYQQYKMNQQYSRHMDNLYQKSFYELVGSVGSVENGLAKLMASGDRSQHAMLLSQISRQADAAQMDLGQLPNPYCLDKTASSSHSSVVIPYFLNKEYQGKAICKEWKPETAS